LQKNQFCFRNDTYFCFRGRSISELTPSITENIDLSVDFAGSEERSVEKDDAHMCNSLTWLLSGLYAMLVFDIGLVMKICQFIVEDVRGRP